MNTCLRFGLAALLCHATLAGGQGPKPNSTPKTAVKPQWQRLLTGEDARKAAALEKQVVELLNSGRTADAAKVAEELLTFRTERQGEDHWKVRDVRLAIAGLKRPALTAAQQRKIDEAGSLNGEVVRLHRTGKYRDAIPLAEKSLQLKKEVLGDGHPDTATALNNLAMLYDSLGQIREAEPLYKKSLRICREVYGDSHPATAGALQNLAGTHQSRAQYPEAEALYKEALQVYREAVGDAHPDTALAQNNLGNLYQELSRYAEAEPLLNDALRTWRKVRGDKHPDTALALHNLALLYKRQSRYAEAESLNVEALKIRREAQGENHPETVQGMNNLAALYDAQGRYAQAEALYLDALRIRRKVLGDNHPATAQSLNNLAALYWTQGRAPEAVPLFKDALRIKRAALGDRHPDTATTVNNLAMLLDSEGRHADAEPLYVEVLGILKETLGNRHPLTASAQQNLAAVWREQGRFADAEPLLEEALRIRKSVLGERHPDTALSRNNLAGLYQAKGAYAKAETLYKESLGIWREALGDKHPSTAQSLKNLASLYAVQREYARAAPLLRDAAAAHEASRLVAARTSAERSVARGSISPYPLRSAVAAARNEPLEAFVSLELDLARGLLDDQAARRGVALTAAEQAKQVTLSARWAELQPRILKLVVRPDLTEAERKELAALTAERAKLDGDLSDLATTLSRREVADLAAIQAALPADGAFVTWVDATDASGRLQEHWVCVLRRTGVPRWERLPGTGPGGAWVKADTELPRTFWQALAADPPRPPAEIDALARKLREQRMGPVAKHLGGVKNLYVAAVRRMAGVPVELLADEYTVSYVPSGTFLARQGKPVDRPATLLAVGDPVFADRENGGGRYNPETNKKEPWPELPGTAVELAGLKALFGDRAAALARSEASEQRLDDLRAAGKLAQYRYLHFATHGEGNDLKPFESRLILAQDRLPPFDPTGTEPAYNGEISAAEVLEHWKLDAELVTLSACESGFGRAAGGDGILGFAQAFLLAGSRSVCLSLWKVDDAATALLMDRFYHNLLGRRDGLKEPMPKAQALAEAKRWLRGLSAEEAISVSAQMRKGVVRGKGAAPLPPAKVGDGLKPFAHPRFWAAFVLIGETR